MPTRVPPPRLIEDSAVDALRLFAGDDLDQHAAALLLPLWEHYHLLTPLQAAAIVEGFPRPVEAGS